MPWSPDAREQPLFLFCLSVFVFWSREGMNVPGGCPSPEGAHVGAGGDADGRAAVPAAPAAVAEAVALQAVAVAAAVIELRADARQQPWIPAHQLRIRTLHPACMPATAPEISHMSRPCMCHCRSLRACVLANPYSTARCCGHPGGVIFFLFTVNWESNRYQPQRDRGACVVAYAELAPAPPTSPLRFDRS